MVADTKLDPYRKGQRNAQGKLICGSRKKSGPDPCQSDKVMANGRCQMHGGKSRKGIAHPNYQGKGYSDYVPTGLLDDYLKFANDPDKLVLDHQIAIVDTYMVELLESLGDYSSPVLWEQLQQQVIEYKKAPREQKAELLNYIWETIEAGASYVSKWDTLHKALEQRRKLVADERKRRVEAEQMIPIDQAMLVLTALLESVRRHVNDPAALSAVQDEFNRLVGTARQYQLDGGAAADDA